MNHLFVRIVLTVFCLGLVVVIHELGHLVMALKLGVRVERFTVGFGPELFGWTSRKIRYAICAVPLGGMVKLAGEFQDERADKPDEFFSQPWYCRNLIALAGPLMNYALAFVLFAVVAGVWGTAQPSDQPVVGDVVPGLPAAAAKLQENDDGPVIYTDFMMARVAAQMIDVQLGQRPGRTEAREYQEGPKRLRETVKTRMTPEEALAAMESGKVI